MGLFVLVVQTCKATDIAGRLLLINMCFLDSYLHKSLYTLSVSNAVIIFPQRDDNIFEKPGSVKDDFCEINDTQFYEASRFFHCANLKRLESKSLEIFSDGLLSAFLTGAWPSFLPSIFQDVETVGNT